MRSSRITLSMITYNSIKRVGPEILAKVLRSSLEVPYDAIILVDDSEDGLTRDFVRRFA
jgi:hypothetical protein